jgi:hypothetical protein
VRVFVVAVIAVSASGCVTTGGDTVNFQPKSYQQAIMRDGDPIINSRGKNSIVSLRPATHLVADRPVFIVGIQNVSRYPLDFRVSEATAGQTVDGSGKSLRIYTYDELVSQEQTAQVGRALLVGMLQGVNAGIVGDAAAANTNAQLAASAAVTNQQNMADLEQLAIKDHTLMPGESYAGKLYVEPPAGMSNQKFYFIELKVGPDRHDFEVVQASAVR